MLHSYIRFCHVTSTLAHCSEGARLACACNAPPEDELLCFWCCSIRLPGDRRSDLDMDGHKG